MKISNFDINKSIAGVFIALFAINSIASDSVNGVNVANLAKAAQANNSKSVNDWLQRVHDASRRRSYTGTFVVSVGSEMASARIWHVCDGVQQMERVESLTGTPRSTFRHNSRVTTFFPEAKVVRSEQREALGLFPNFINSKNNSLSEFYVLKPLEPERVAGVEAEVVQLVAKDALRYSYRIWTERKSGLVVKLQTLDVTGNIIEQSAFSELTLDATVQMASLVSMMNNTTGLQVEQVENIKTTALSQGWALQRAVPGFQSMNCYARLTKGQQTPRSNPKNEVDKVGTMQWIFSDGLAAVSLFIESFDRNRHGPEGVWAMGATRTLTKKMDGWWLTVVGEVPVETLVLFADRLERKK